MMRTRTYATGLALLALLPFGAMVAPAQNADRDDRRTPAQHDMSKTDMSAMMNEPHQVVAQAYLRSIGVFARALHGQAEHSRVIDAPMARVIVDELKRSRDRMEDHHKAHMQTVSDDMLPHMAAMIRDGDMHRSMLADAIHALEKSVHADPPESKRVSMDCATVLKHVEELSSAEDRAWNRTRS